MGTRQQIESNLDALVRSIYNEVQEIQQIAAESEAILDRTMDRTTEPGNPRKCGG